MQKFDQSFSPNRCLPAGAAWMMEKNQKVFLSAAYGHDSEQPDNQVRCNPSLFSSLHFVFA